jgi:hypothetical protein
VLKPDAMTNCTLPDCQGQAFAKGLCVKHYTRMRRHGDPAKVLPAGRKISDAVEDADDDDPGGRLLLLYHRHDMDRWCDGSSDQSIASLIAGLKAHVETRREDIAGFIAQYRAGMPIHILDFCARMSSAMRQDGWRKAVVATVKEVKVADHLAAVGKGGDLGRLSVTAFCHWAISQVAEASEVEAFFAALMDDEIEHEPILHHARSQLIHQARSKKHVNSPYAPYRQAWIILQAWIECRTGAKFEGKSGGLPTLEDLGASLEFRHATA